jgi:hypothetical protein
MIIPLLLLTGALVSAASFAFYQISKDPEDRSGILGFFYDNKRLFRDIVDDALDIEGSWFIEHDGYVVTLYGMNDMGRMWHPGLSENALTYYRQGPSLELYIEGDEISGHRVIIFEFFDAGNRTMERIIYCEEGLSEEAYRKVANNWYYEWAGLT